MMTEVTHNKQLVHREDERTSEWRNASKDNDNDVTMLMLRPMPARITLTRTTGEGGAIR